MEIKKPVIKPPTNSGRLGNQTSLCAYALLYSIHTGTDFKNNYNITLPLCPPKFIKNEEGPIEIPELEDYSQTVKEKFPQDVRLFQNYRDILIDFFLPDPDSSEVILESDYDIVIHLRTDDIDNHHKSYTALPFSFYKESLLNVIENNSGLFLGEKVLNILIVCKKPHNKFTNNIIEVLLDEIDKTNKSKEWKNERIAWNGIFNCNTFNETLEEDFRKMLGAKIYISSISTLSFWAAFLGPYCREVHIPYWGLFTSNGGTGLGNLHLDEWYSDEIQVILHNINLREKIKNHNIHLLRS